MLISPIGAINFAGEDKRRNAERWNFVRQALSGGYIFGHRVSTRENLSAETRHDFRKFSGPR